MSLQTPFNKPVYGNTDDLSGALPTERGNDPLISVEGSSALKTPFEKPIEGTMDTNETANSVSGLPLQPQRFQPSETPPEPPTLKDRNPGTIDK